MQLLKLSILFCFQLHFLVLDFLLLQFHQLHSVIWLEFISKAQFIHFYEQIKQLGSPIVLMNSNEKEKEIYSISNTNTHLLRLIFYSTIILLLFFCHLNRNNNIKNHSATFYNRNLLQL